MHSPAMLQEEEHSQFETILTKHAAERMCVRGLPSNAVAAAIAYGRTVHVRGADIHAIGRREIEWCRREGIDLTGYEGVQVVCASDGSVLTVYRNRNFRGLRPRRRRRARRRQRYLVC